MNSKLFWLSPSSCLLSIIILVFIEIPLSSSNPVFCSKPFTCGKITTGYPFWGNDLDFCGPPGFELSCEDGQTMMEINHVRYQVMNVDNTKQILKIAREDYLGGICPLHFANTTLDPSLFELDSGYDNFTLFYGCRSSLYGPGGLFSCSINGVNYGDGFVEPGSKGPGYCKTSVTVPLPHKPEMTYVDLEILEEALKDGFEVKWKVNSTACRECTGSKGICGYDIPRNKFTCYCKDERPLGSRTTCPGNSKTVKLAVGILSGGLGVAFIFLGCWFLRWRWRKRKAAQSKSNELLPTPLSSQGLTTPSTNLSQSIPSYSTSNFDPEKGSGYFGAQVFSFTELEEATDNFDPSKELGDGGFGTVYYGLLKDGRVVAVKRLYENNFKRAEQFMTEVEILTRLRHPNLVTLYGCTSRRSRELLLVYEYIPNGTVADHLHGNRAKSGLLTWPVRLSIAVETANALAFLHASDVIHRDVKTNNILLDNNFRVKVADFGLSRLFPTDVTHVSTAPQGTPGYVDPEYYQCYQLTDKSDVYSFGVVLVELISSKEAVDTNRHRHDINLANMAVSRIQNHELHELVDPSLGFENNYAVRTMMTSVAELAFRCLQQERDLRPSMEEVLEVLKEIENEELGAQKAEVVDIRADDVGLLKNISPPLSPDSVVNDKWLKVRSL